MTVTSNFNYGRVQAIGQSVFRVMINNWGNRGTGADANSLAYGSTVLPDQAIGSAFAVAIGPDSTVDRAVISFNPFFNGASVLPLPETYNPNQQQLVSVPRPSGRLAGPLNVRASNINFYQDAYFKDGDPAQKPFGGTEPLFESPVLELDFYLTPSGVPLPTKRNPMFRRMLIDATARIGAGEQLLGIFPVFGRKSFTAHFRGTGDINGTVRVGAITYSYQGSPATLVCTEATLGSEPFNATTMAQTALAQGLNAQYLALYYTAAAGTGGFVEGHLLAEDDMTCCGNFVAAGPA